MSVDGCNLAKIDYSLGRAINQNLKEPRLTKPNYWPLLFASGGKNPCT